MDLRKLPATIGEYNYEGTQLKTFGYGLIALFSLAVTGIAAFKVYFSKENFNPDDDLYLYAEPGLATITLDQQ